MARHNTNRFEDAVVEGMLIDDPQFLRGIVERALQEVLEAEMTAHVGAERYQRGEERRGQRNGYKPRSLKTRVGTLELWMPQDRDGTFSTALFARYQRNEKALVLSLMQMYLEGVSTRKVADITEALCGTSFSASLVSTLTGRLDAQLAAWRSRPLTAGYAYLWVDARYERARVDGRIISQGVLIVKGVRDDGHREILAVEVADTESEATYQELFRELKARGLAGVQLVTSDDHKGLRAAIARHFQGASWQRCQVHYTRNLVAMVSSSRRGELSADLREVFTAADPGQASRRAADLAGKWRASYPKVAEHVEEEIEDCFACYGFPPQHRGRIRSTNGLERLNQELKRRTRVVRIFPDRASVLRLVTAMCQDQSDEWVSGSRYLDMELLWAWLERRQPQERELALA